jgi:copper(I)-binding protein
VVAAAFALTGCSAGAVTQTAGQASAVNGYSGQVGNLLVRNASIDFPPSAAPTAGAAYQPGGAAPISLTLVNNGASADKLLSVSSPVAGAGQITGDATVPGGSTVTVGNNTGTDSQALAGRTISIKLTGLVGPVRAGLTYPNTLRFQNAGVLNGELPVGEPSAAPEAQKK